MTEPVSTLKSAGLLAGGLSLAAYGPGVDGNVLIGAFAGAAVFVLHRRESPVVVRLLHFCASVAIGYLSAPELLRYLPIESPGVCAAIGAACAVTVINAVIDALDKCDLIALLQQLFGKERKPK